MRHSVLNQSNKIDNSINFNRNKCYRAIIFAASLYSCYWVSNCIYSNTTKSPGDIYRHVIVYDHDDNLNSRQEATVCRCHDNTSDCIQDRFNPIQAGRTVSLRLQLIDSNFSVACLAHCNVVNAQITGSY